MSTGTAQCDTVVCLKTIWFTPSEPRVNSTPQGYNTPLYNTYSLCGVRNFSNTALTSQDPAFIRGENSLKAREMTHAWLIYPSQAAANQVRFPMPISFLVSLDPAGLLDLIDPLAELFIVFVNVHLFLTAAM